MDLAEMLESGKKGSFVKVRAYGGQVLVRRVVNVNDQKVYICTDEEFRRAEEEEGREPRCVGFPPEDVIEVVESMDEEEKKGARM